MIWILIFALLLSILILLGFEFSCWKKQIRDISAQLQKILNGETQKYITITLMDKNLEKMTEMINKIVENERVNLGRAQRKEDKQKENIACLSHDLRTPLTSIRGYLELMQKATDEKRPLYIEALQAKALRLEQLINDFYQISLLDDNEFSYKKEKIELNNFITNILLDNYSLFEKNKITPEIHLIEEEIFIASDKMALTRVFQNLIVNAVHSTAGNLNINLIFNDEQLIISIQNSIKEDSSLDSTRIFDRFYSGDFSRSNGNSGQGLYIVRKLLMQLGCEEPRVTISKKSFEIIVNLTNLYEIETNISTG